MNLSRMLRFSLPVLGLLVGLGQNALLYAQNQPQATPCPLEGPSIQDTLKYLNDALSMQVFNSKGQTTDSYSLSVDDGKVILSEKSTRQNDNNAIWMKSFSSVYDLNCHARGVPGNSYTVVADCINYAGCVHTGWNGDLAMPGFSMFFDVDQDKGQHLVRAFSHFIALLQQQYKQSHSDPNDPFAKPQ